MMHPWSDLYRQAEDYFFRGIAIKCLDFADQATAYLTGIPVADLNPVFVASQTKGFEKLLSVCEVFYRNNDSRFVLVIPDIYQVPTGYQLTEKTVAMGLQLSVASFSDTSDAVIRANDEHLQEWMLPLVAAFNATLFETTLQYARAHEMAIKKGVRLYHFNLYEGDKPVTAITLSVHNNIARIDDLGTLPEYQSRGHATCLMSYTLEKAKKLGAHYCFLEASESGLGLYQKLGFVPLFRNANYSQV